MNNAVSSLRWLLLDLNSFFASCEQQENPALRDKPIAVAPLLSDSTCAIAASYPAKAYGIKTGTKIYEARNLCPDLVVVPARPPLYVAYHDRIIKSIEKLIPIEEVLSIDEVACRLDKSQQDPAKARALALALKRQIQKDVGCCLTSSVGVAANKLLAKLASDMQKPDGLTLLLPEEMPGPILSLPINALSGVGARMTERLQQAGLHTMADLWAADGAFLRRVWGSIGGLRFHELLHGADLDEAPTQKRMIGRQHVLAPEERSLVKARPILRQLLMRASEKLRRYDYYAQQLVLDIKWVQSMGDWGCALRFQQTQDTRLFLEAFEKLYAQAPSFKPWRVGVALTELTPASAYQGDLFAQTPRASGKLASVIDQLNTKYGRDTITYGVPTAPLATKIAFRSIPTKEDF